MKRLATFALLSVFCMVFGIQSVFAGPFGIDMGMSLAKIKRISKTVPKDLGDNKYEITPPKTSDLFESYLVWIDSDYGVYAMKAIGKDIHTNGYGDRLKSTFNLLVESIRKTYGEESYKRDEMKEGSIWSEPRYFMHALQEGDRELYAMWSRELNTLQIELDIKKKILSDTVLLEKLAPITDKKVQDLVLNKMSEYKKLPSDIAVIGVYANALSSSLGYVALEYSFSNNDAVKEKADSVF